MVSILPPFTLDSPSAVSSTLCRWSAYSPLSRWTFPFCSVQHFQCVDGQHTAPVPSPTGLSLLQCPRVVQVFLQFVACVLSVRSASRYMNVSWRHCNHGQEQNHVLQGQFASFRCPICQASQFGTRSKHRKGSNERYLLGQNRTFGAKTLYVATKRH